MFFDLVFLATRHVVLAVTFQNDSMFQCSVFFYFSRVSSIIKIPESQVYLIGVFANILIELYPNKEGFEFKYEK